MFLLLLLLHRLTLIIPVHPFPPPPPQKKIGKIAVLFHKNVREISAKPITF